MKFRKYLNVSLIIIILFYWLRMFIGETGSSLSSRGFSSLKYFTVLSNLFEAFACIRWLYKKDERIKYIASSAVGLTFVVVLVFLGPLFGYSTMYIGSNFWFHLIVPVVSIIEFIIFNQKQMTRKDNFLVVIPMFIYAIGYVGNVLINGIGFWPNTNDWYGFFTWGCLGGIIVFVIISIVTYMIGYAIRKINNLFLKQLLYTYLVR